MNPDISTPPPSQQPPPKVPAEAPLENGNPPDTSRKAKKSPIFVVFVLLALIVIAVVLTLSLSHNPKTTTKSSSSTTSNATPSYDNSKFSAEAVVEIKDNTFNPTELGVKSHTRVNFENKDNVDRKLSLNDPTQKDGPAKATENNPNLPNNVVINPGNGVAHVFEKPGTYIFHLVDNPSQNITIQVQ